MGKGLPHGSPQGDSLNHTFKISSCFVRRLSQPQGKIVRRGHVIFKDCPECNPLKDASCSMLHKEIRVGRLRMRWHMAHEGRSKTELLKFRISSW